MNWRKAIMILSLKLRSSFARPRVVFRTNNHV
jgi:hypothetical protein